MGRHQRLFHQLPIRTRSHSPRHCKCWTLRVFHPDRHRNPSRRSCGHQHQQRWSYYYYYCWLRDSDRDIQTVVERRHCTQSWRHHLGRHRVSPTDRYKRAQLRSKATAKATAATSRCSSSDDTVGTCGSWCGRGEDLYSYHCYHVGQAWASQLDRGRTIPTSYSIYSIL